VLVAAVLGVNMAEASAFTYTLHKDMVTPRAARLSCAAQGKALAMPKTRAQLDAFLKVLSREVGGRSQSVWIDIGQVYGRRTFGRGRGRPFWVWGDGEVAKWTSWKRGQPDGGRDEECVAISSSSKNGEWYDTLCKYTAWYICQA